MRYGKQRTGHGKHFVCVLLFVCSTIGSVEKVEVGGYLTYYFIGVWANFVAILHCAVCTSLHLLVFGMGSNGVLSFFQTFV